MGNHFSPWRLREKAEGVLWVWKEASLDTRLWTQGNQVGGLTVWLPILAGGTMPEEAQGSSHQGALVGKLREEVCERGHDTLVQLK